MIEIRWHGRGGQGAVTAAELLAKAAIDLGKHAQAFPYFGPERRGAPVAAFTRIDSAPIDISSQIYEPDVVVVLDPTLPQIADVTEGLKEGGVLIMNASRPIAELKERYPRFRLAAVDATAIALDKLGAAITNTAMLGAVVKATGAVSLDSVIRVVSERFDRANVAAVQETYSRTVVT